MKFKRQRELEAAAAWAEEREITDQERSDQHDEQKQRHREAQQQIIEAQLGAARKMAEERRRRQEEALDFLKKGTVKDRALADKASPEDIEELRRRMDELERPKQEGEEPPSEER